VNSFLFQTGHIRTSAGSYFIEPAENWRDHTSPILHAVYRIPATNSAEEEGLHQCGVVGEWNPAITTCQKTCYKSERKFRANRNQKLLSTRAGKR
jgi:hypothetical protein